LIPKDYRISFYPSKIDLVFMGILWHNIGYSNIWDITLRCHQTWRPAGKMWEIPAENERFPGQLWKHMGNKHYKWRFMAGKIIEQNGRFSSGPPCLMRVT